MKPDDWLGAIRERESSGDLLAAFDMARRALAEYPKDTALQHRSILVLARAGATEEAVRRFRDWDLQASDDPEVLALGARLAKDRALASSDPETRGTLLARAADQYANLHDGNGDPYPAINAATLWMLAGQEEKSHLLAREVLRLVDATSADSNEDKEAAYYRLATRAEALLLLDDTEGARRALEEAATALPEDFSARATTRKQLARIIEYRNLSQEALAPLTVPTVAHYSGHLILPAGREGRFPAEAEDRVCREICKAIDDHDIGYGFGSLGAGADILIAEAILERGGGLHVVLPFREEEFIEQSVRPSGDAWVERYHRCREQADAVSHATRDQYLEDDMLFGYCARYSMGLAMLRSRHLDAPLRQLAVWDGKLPDEPAVAGTAHDILAWQELNLPRTVIDPGGRGAPGRQSRAGLRENRAFVFGDMKGYGKLTDAEILIFQREVLARMRDVLDRHAERVETLNSWGDAIHAVFNHATDAAHFALDLQESISELDLAALDLPEHLMLRVGAHYGPAMQLTDPVLDRPTSVGGQVNLAARIEPVAMPGSVYVSEPFAAMLELSRDPALAADYVGTIAAAKEYGSLAMYRLRRG